MTTEREFLNARRDYERQLDEAKVEDATRSLRNPLRHAALLYRLACMRRRAGGGLIQSVTWAAALVWRSTLHGNP